MFFHSVGNVIIPTDELTFFSESSNHQPDRDVTLEQFINLKLFTAGMMKLFCVPFLQADVQRMKPQT